MLSLILASLSPQRKSLLEGLGLTFVVVPSTVQEDVHPEQNPVQRAKELAKLKAQDVHRLHPDAVVIGCDTLVVASDGTLLEKPVSADDARRMLALQSGTTSMVHSAVCVVDTEGTAHEDISSSAVTFKTLSEQEIDWWIRTRLWEGRSGGFQIDGPGQLMIERLEGDWTGVVGLPVFVLGALLEKANVTYTQ